MKLNFGNGMLRPDQFLCGASDKNGHSIPVSFRALPEITGRLEALIQEKVFPYSTSSDFIRDAIFHRLDQLVVLKPEIRGKIYPILLLGMVQQEELEKGIWLQTIERLQYRVKNMAPLKAKLLLEKYEGKIAEAPETEDKQWALTEVRKLIEKVEVIVNA